MIWIKMRQMAFVLLAVALLVLSLLLTACGSSATNAGNSNIQQPITSQPSSTSTAGNIDQQVQNAVQSIDGAQNDVNNADGTATTENGNDPQP